MKNYSEGVKGIVEVKLTTDNAKFVVAGKKPGTTTLLLINKDDSTVTWVINVFSRAPEAVRRSCSSSWERCPVCGCVVLVRGSSSRAVWPTKGT